MLDWIIKDALIADGSGKAPYSADIAIQQDRIVDIGILERSDARRVTEAKGRMVTPGFIDMHSHSDALYLHRASLALKIYQGVSTEVIGQDGMSVAPVSEWSKTPLSEEMMESSPGFKTMKEFVHSLEEKIPLNVASLVGHCNLRLAVMEDRNAPPSSEELHDMGELLRESLDQGAVGLSLGLIYPPSSYSSAEELIHLGNVVKSRDSILVAHVRDEQDGIMEALEEMITVGRESGCRIHISHLKCLGQRNWGRMEKVLETLDRASEQGVDLSFDQYPYTASCTSLSVLLPGWAQEGGWKAFEQRLGSSEIRGSILETLRKNIEDRGGASSITIASVRNSKNQEWVGGTLEQISSHWKVPVEEAALEILAREQLKIIAIYHAMSEADVERAMVHPLQVVGSDGVMAAFPHPRVFGTFPRIIHHFSLQRKLFSLEQAIRKMTSAPAERLRLKHRGYILPGYHADLTVFSPEKFRDMATFEHPSQPASGLDWLFVSGVPVLSEGRMIEACPGHVLRRH